MIYALADLLQMALSNVRKGDFHLHLLEMGVHFHQAVQGCISIDLDQMSRLNLLASIMCCGAARHLPFMLAFK